MNSPEAVEQFRQAARQFTLEATVSKEAAIKVLKKEGILNSKGKLHKNYSSEK